MQKHIVVIRQSKASRQMRVQRSSLLVFLTLEGERVMKMRKSLLVC